MGLQQVLEREITSLRPYPRNARTHSKKQIKQIANSIERFGLPIQCWCPMRARSSPGTAG